MQLVELKKRIYFKFILEPIPSKSAWVVIMNQEKDQQSSHTIWSCTEINEDG